ncbi:MAG TPA: class IV adenylate cyclase [Anaerolineales bacterium]|nr:class IV adenylate cyclase [Anaerolineales bacterium]
MGREVEAKFYVRRLEDIKRRLEAAGAVLVKPRVLEVNLRFDTHEGALRQAGRVLRLRQDAKVRLTYKDLGRVQDGALSRRELEFDVSNLDAAREFLEALGYEVSFIYEKYRTTYRLDDLEIDVDEMPYGNFVEIEGSGSPIQPTAEKLGLKWSSAIQSSYSQLFEALRARRGLEFRDLTFDNLKHIRVAAADLEVQAADT